MKLIRLTSTEETASFDSLFNEDVFIEPNSKVALAQLCLDSEANTVVIDASNDEITFNMFKNRVGNVDRSITLNHTDGTGGKPEDYNKNNFQELINDMIFKINQQLQTDYSTSTTAVQTAELGTQFTMGIGSDKLQSGKMVLSFVMSALNSRYTDLVQNIKLVGGAASLVNNNADDGSIWNRTEGATAVATNENMTYGTYPITRGAGVWRTRINTWIDDAGEPVLQSGMIWALTTVSPSTYGATPMTNAQITYGIHCDKVAGTYKFIKDGVFTDSGIAPVYGTSVGTRPHIELSVSGGRVKATIYQSDGAGGSTISRDVIDESYDLLTGETQPPPLYPVVIVRGGFNTGISGIRFTDIKQTTDPFLDTKNLYEGSVTTNEVSLPTPIQPGAFRASGSSYFFNFGSISLASYFGFNDARIPVTNTLRAIQKVIIPTNKFVYTDLSEAILVLLDSIKLKSYDSFDSLELGEGGRRNLLSVIPVPNTKDIIYEPSSLLFLDIDNANEQYIRNIKARVLKTDYSPVKTNGLTTMVLLFKGPNE